MGRLNIIAVVAGTVTVLNTIGHAQISRLPVPQEPPRLVESKSGLRIGRFRAVRLQKVILLFS